MMKKAVIIIIVLLYGCIGTDIRDDSMVPEQIVITTGNKSILIGKTWQLEASYSNEYGISEEKDIAWTSDMPDVAAVNINGLVTGLSRGQAEITAHVNDVFSEAIRMSVVAKEDDIADIRITSAKTMIGINETVQLMARAFDVNGNELPGKVIIWANKKPEVASLSAAGVLTGKVDGTAVVEASAEGINSDEYRIVVGNEVKMASFQSSGGYSASGTATLSYNNGGQLILNLSNDFQTDFALGTFIFLANTTNGQNVKSGGLNLGEIKSGGAKTFNISDFDTSVELSTYRYVIVLCRPAAITFGFADFNQ